MVKIENADGDKEPVIIREWKAGDVFGGMSLYTHEPFYASIISQEKTVLYRLTAQAIETMAAQDPGLASAAGFYSQLPRVARPRAARSSLALIPRYARFF